MSKKSVGQALTEYLIIGALVLIVAIGALTVLGKTTSQLFANMLGSRNAGATTQASAAGGAGPSVTAGGGTSSSSASSSPAATSASGGSVTFTSANGTAISLPNYPENVSKSIDTVGANGTTDLLANQLVDMAKQLKAEGTISDQQYNSLVALSNQGHRLADFERILEGNYSPQTADKFETMTFTVQGQQYTGNEIHSVMGFQGAMGAQISDPLNAPASDEIARLQSLYKSAQQSGAMSDPAVANVVQGLTSQIALLNQYVNNIDDASARTDINSVGICGAGGSGDSGVHCSG